MSGCTAQQINRQVPDFYCAKERGHTGGHIDPKSRKVWGTPQLPYGMRGAKASRKRKSR